MAIEARVVLKTDAAPVVGRERIALLEAVARQGSISAGAREAGLSYKAAWDALDAMSNLFGTPLVVSQVGGKSGGGARLTAAGERAIAAFRRLEAELGRIARAVEPDLAGTGISPLSLFSGFAMKTSARNALRGTVRALSLGGLSVEVEVEVGDRLIYALVTQDSLRELGLFEGRAVILLIKAPFVMLAVGETPPVTSVRNCISGIVRRCEILSPGAEVTLDIGAGRSLVATITATSAESLGLQPGHPAHAMFDAGHVILAID
ncbi:TOBE domain-containing protein [Aurantimonas sp. MSK8Z-1]|uniref:TOBE domain-containing protein n=1 Tax=Mangrovibrevibacter kandeliae TaxID=2968473 RepID=UPI0021174C31|nr:TOBE domain-containing protein [Aurantimonas sp. MSK8Z-1]MCW4114706.1 TOBE domain-containing protein [Aurantimonas sp. MSK8Z-1]